MLSTNSSRLWYRRQILFEQMFLGKTNVSWKKKPVQAVPKSQSSTAVYAKVGLFFNIKHKKKYILQKPDTVKLLGR